MSPIVIGLIDEAIQSLEECGRYWATGLPPAYESEMCKALSNEGYPVEIRYVGRKSTLTVLYSLAFPGNSHEEVERIGLERCLLEEAEAPDWKYPR